MRAWTSFRGLTEGRSWRLPVHCGGCRTLGSELDKFMDIFCAAAAVAALLKAEFRLELTGHDTPRSPRITNIRLCDSPTQANEHLVTTHTRQINDYEKRSQYAMSARFCQLFSCRLVTCHFHLSYQ
jgi:hypothetical protein